jgi:hypothetical protein
MSPPAHRPLLATLPPPPYGGPKMTETRGKHHGAAGSLFVLAHACDLLLAEIRRCLA